LNSKPKFRFVEKGEREDEDVYMALGQTEGGRYLTVLFIHKIRRKKREKCMKENNPQSLPSFASLDELVEFFDTNDMGDYLDEMPEANFDVDIKRRTHLVAIDEELVVKLNEIARLKQIPAESLVNSWLKEKISDYPEKT